MFQQVVIAGYVGRDPEMRYTQRGQAVCDFSLAVTQTWTVGEGDSKEKREETTWFRVTCWGKLAETVNQWVTKGKGLLVIGTVKASAWLDKEGEAQATLEVTAKEVKFLGGGKGQHENPTAPEEMKGEDIPF